jgi:hypothetical protein
VVEDPVFSGTNPCDPLNIEVSEFRIQVSEKGNGTSKY